jgi:BirA family transcriptional regulator, biotin operon repressor / biotin---[acetyl-CoA-carboxylase] ligase
MSSGRLGHPRVHLRLLASTNDRARELALAGAPHGTLVTAAEQSAGRGRHGRRWSAPAGSALLMSLLVRRPPKLLPLSAALAVCDAAGPEALIKWPNDIVVPIQQPPGLAKLAGILAEGRPGEGWVVVGIGLNVAVAVDELPAELRPGSTSAAGLPAASMGLARTDVEPVLARLLAALAARLVQDETATLEAWRERDALRGRAVSWSGGAGTADGIDGEGRLIVSLPGGGRSELAAGEVHLSANLAGAGGAP